MILTRPAARAVSRLLALIARARLGRTAALLLALCAAGGSAALANGDLRGHGGPVKSVQLASDEGLALTGSFDYSIILWSLAGEGPEAIARLIGHDAAVNSVAFTPDRRLAVSGSDDGTVGLWDLQDRTLVHRFRGHEAKVVQVAVSPDGRLAASASWDKTIRLWNLADRSLAGVLEGHASNVNAVAFSADGSKLYSGGYDGTVRLWDVARASEVRTLMRHGWGVNVLQPLPDGNRLLFGALDGTVKLIDPASGDVVRILESHDGPVLAVAASPAHDMVATGGGDGRINVWRASDPRLKYTHDHAYGPVWALDFTGDGKAVYYAGLDDFAIRWQMEPAKAFEVAKGTFPRRFQVGDDVELGERQFARKCSVCHTLVPDDANRAGPTLYKLFGRRAGTLPGYAYSDALKNSTVVWDERTIAALFTEGPEHYLPGTKMPLQRMTNEEERDALIAYLKRATEAGRTTAGGAAKGQGGAGEAAEKQ